MTSIIDLELTVRLGSLDADRAARIQKYATSAFLWRGMRQVDALDVARGLHWHAVGRDPSPPAVEILDALALHPLADRERERLTDRLQAADDAHGDTPGRTALRLTASAPGPADHQRTGRRLARALALLDPVERAVA